MLIVECCAKWLIWVLKNSKKKFKKNYVKDIWTWTIVASKEINFVNY
jgi:hypothetical protein